MVPKGGKKKQSSTNRSLTKNGAIMRFSLAMMYRKKMLWKKKYSETKAEPKIVIRKKQAPETKVKKMA